MRRFAAVTFCGTMSRVAGAVTVLYILAVFWRGVDLHRKEDEAQALESPSPPYDETLLSSLHVFVEHDPPTVTAIFSFQPPSDCLQGQDYNYTITVWTRGNVMKEGKHAGPFTASSCDGFKIPVESLERDALYSASIVAYSGGLKAQSRTIQFRTNCVQLAAVVVGERHMKIVCRFAKGSAARGCHVEIEYENTYTSAKLHQNTLNVPMEDASLESSTCLELKSLGRVRVYDWMEDGSVGSIAVTPVFKEGSDSVCDLESKQSIADAGRIALFYASAVLMAAGIIAITIGMLCKLGRLTSHFKKYSHAPIENAEDS